MHNYSKGKGELFLPGPSVQAELIHVCYLSLGRQRPKHIGALLSLAGQQEGRQPLCHPTCNGKRHGNLEINLFHQWQVTQLPTASARVVDTLDPIQSILKCLTFVGCLFLKMWSLFYVQNFMLGVQST